MSKKYIKPKASPRLQIVSFDDMECVFLLSKCNISLANEFRRVITSEIPTMAIDYVDIEENTSSLHDDFMARRLGLVPFISTHAKDYVLEKDCTCGKYCEKCTVVFSLDVTCPNSKREINVMSHDLKFIRGKTDSQGPLVYPGENIVINKLTTGQSLKLTAFVYKGYGKMNSKWAAANVAMSYQRDIVPNYLSFNKYSVSTRKNIKDVLNIVRPLDPEDAKKILYIEKEKFIDFAIDDEEIIYKLEMESFGMLSPLDILRTAIDIILKKL